MTAAKWRYKHPCASCDMGYGFCVQGWIHSLQCCTGCSHPTHREGYTDAELDLMDAESGERNRTPWQNRRDVRRLCIIGGPLEGKMVETSARLGEYVPIPLMMSQTLAYAKDESPLALSTLRRACRVGKFVDDTGATVDAIDWYNTSGNNQ